MYCMCNVMCLSSYHILHFLHTPDTSNALYSKTSSLSPGVPKGRRGEVWLLFSQQHRLRHRLPPGRHAPDTPYQDLLKQLTAQQHSILVDLGMCTCMHSHTHKQRHTCTLAHMHTHTPPGLAEPAHCPVILHVCTCLFMY